MAFTMKNPNYKVIEKICDKSKEINNLSFNQFNKYKLILYSLIDFLKENENSSNIRQDFNNLYNKLVLNKENLYIKKNLLLTIYRALLESKEIEYNENMLYYLQKKPSRNLSGVTLITCLLSPFPNKTDVARDKRSNLDAIKQMTERFNSLLEQGHKLDKLEIILEGETYTEYCLSYLEDFHRDLYYTANTYFNQQYRKPISLEDEMFINRNFSDIKIIGVCVETRPDALTHQWLINFRNLGVTRVQLGLQHTDNKLLRKVNRRAYDKDFIKAIRYLKDNCFKVDIHVMPDLPFSTPSGDIDMLNIIYESDSYKPDQLKIYPCQVSEFTKIKKWYDTGKYIPYSETDVDKFIEVMQYGLKKCPPYMRVSRVVSNIRAGNKVSNLRQMLTDKMNEENIQQNDIRSREIVRHPSYLNKKQKLTVRSYVANRGIEYFISFESEDERVIYGFCRLRIPDNNSNIRFPELRNMGLIRELHVYGRVLSVGYNNSNYVQHEVLGKKLLAKAAQISFVNNKEGTAVISGVGDEKYYEKLGYSNNGHYMTKEFKLQFQEYIKYAITFCFIFYIFVLLGNFPQQINDNTDYLKLTFY
jgi:ELP3 family radical SAM enzyme/protein acetyltransferase